jgi:predicted dehydrogenase
MYRHHPQILKIIELLNEDIIGNLISMKSNFGKDILYKKNFFGLKTIKKPKKENRLFSKELGGGAILDLGCYPVSLSLLIASLKLNLDLKNIELLNIKKNFGNTEVDIDSYLEINFDNKFRSHVAASFTKNLGKESEITGDKGKLIIKDSWHGKPSIIKIINKDEKEFEVKSEHNVYYYQMKNISKNILENKKKPDYPAMNFEDSLINMNIIDKWLNNEK